MCTSCLVNNENQNSTIALILFDPDIIIEFTLEGGVFAFSVIQLSSGKVNVFVSLLACTAVSYVTVVPVQSIAMFTYAVDNIVSINTC